MKYNKMTYYRGQLLKCLTNLEDRIDISLETLNEMLIEEGKENQSSELYKDVEYVLNNNFKNCIYLLDGLLSSLEEKINEEQQK
jgi:hypothetical protein